MSPPSCSSAIPVGEIVPRVRSSDYAGWRDVMLPREHGSWSLAFEPLVFGLLCAPSWPGAWLGLAVVAGFFCRRPLRIALNEHRQVRRRQARQALGICGLLATAYFGAAFVAADGGWLVWLVPTLVCGGIFVAFDAKNGGREEAAEIVGATAFAWLPAPLAVLDGWTEGAALALAAMMIGRAVPTVIFVRAAVRGKKAGSTDLRWAIIASLLPIGIVGALAKAKVAPWWSLSWFVFFLARTLFVQHRPTIQARSLGIFEAAAGAAFVMTIALGWRP